MKMFLRGRYIIFHCDNGYLLRSCLLQVLSLRSNGYQYFCTNGGHQLFPGYEVSRYSPGVDRKIINTLKTVKFFFEAKQLEEIYFVPIIPTIT
jgi:hypothetical protein